MNPVYLVDGWRTPFCRAGGALAGLSAQELATAALAPARTRVPRLPGLADVLLGNVLNGRGNLARYALLAAGLDREVPGSTVDRQCASGLDAIAQAYWRARQAAEPMSLIAGGVESMSQAPFLMSRAVRAYDRRPPAFIDVPLSPPDIGDPSMIDTAETVAREAGVSRERMDRFAAESHRRAVSAVGAGRLSAELVPIEAPVPAGGRTCIEQDVGPRSDTGYDRLAALRPVLPGGTVTAGNASGLADGAAAVVVMNESALAAAGMPALACIQAVSCVGVDPNRMGLGPVPAVRRLLAGTGLAIGQLDLLEINEAFAGQLLAVTDGLGLDATSGQINPDGGAIACGHPLGATGARLAAHMAHALNRMGPGARGVVTLCVGGGMGMAMLLEAV